MDRSQVITLLIPSGVECFRGVIRGVNSYFAKPNGVSFQPVTENVMPTAADWRAKVGAWNPVAFITHLAPEMLDPIRALNKPFVQVLRHEPAARCPAVDIDNIAVGKMAAEHFL